MLAGILIIVISTAMFCYWFRYTCLLILSTRTTQDYAGEVAAANQLSFLEVQQSLALAPSQALEALHSSLERDYRVVGYLMRHVAELPVEGSPLEDIMLRVDFRVLRAWYFLTRSLFPAWSRPALAEMTQIISHFANSFGERVAAGARL